MDKVWEIEDPDERPSRRETMRMEQKREQPKEQNPAAAYTLSLLFWGAGQLYNRQSGKGLLFLFAMIVVYGAGALAFLSREALLPFLRSHRISPTDMVWTGLSLFFFSLLFWLYNASDAYHIAKKARTTAFTGVRSRVYPLLASLLVPGWGQFLNGQPMKGGIFAGLFILGFFSLVTIGCVLFFWPRFEVSEARLVLEMVFTTCLFVAPLLPLVWVLAGFDALQVSLDDIKKEPLLDRLKYANNRRRTQGWVRGLFPHIKLTAALVLLLALLALVAEQSFPKNFYHAQLENTQDQLRKQGMTVVPDLLLRLQELMKRAGM